MIPATRVPLLVATVVFAGIAFTANAQSPIAGQLQGISATPPQASMAKVIEEICPPGNLLGQNLQNRCNEIAVAGAALLGAGDVPGAQAGLQAMAPEQDATVHATTVNIQSTELANVGARLAALRAGARGFTVRHLGLGNENGGGLSGEHMLATSGEGLGGGASADSDAFARWGGFINGNGSFGNRDATPRESGFDFHTGGVTAGVDYRFTDRVIGGVAASFARTDSDLESNGGSLGTNIYSLSLYGTFYPSDAWYVDGAIGGGFANYDQKRAVRYSIAALPAGSGSTTVDQTAKSDFDGSQFSATASSGYNFNRDGWTFGPYGRLQYLVAHVDGFRETVTGGGTPCGCALQIDGQTFNSLTLAAGGQVSKAISMSWGVLVPYANAEYIHEFKNDVQNISGRFREDTTGTTFILTPDNPDRNYVVAGAGVSAVLAHGRSVFVSYQGLIGYNHLTVHAFEAGLRIEF